MNRTEPYEPVINGLSGSPDAVRQTGLACLAWITGYYNHAYGLDQLWELAGSPTGPVSQIQICQVAEKIGFRVRIAQLNYSTLVHSMPLPAIIHTSTGEYMVVLPRVWWNKAGKLKCLDPERGVFSYSKKQFQKIWIKEFPGPAAGGMAILLEPTFRLINKDTDSTGKLKWKNVLQYFRKTRWQLARIFVSLILTSLLQLLFPFVMQSVVDIGINGLDLKYITVLMIAQFALIFSQSVVDIIQSQIFLYISTVVNISVVSDFWIKLTRLPLSYFDKQHAGNILQRINDNKTVHNFFTGPALKTIFSSFTFLVFGFVLVLYEVKLFFIFMAAVLLYYLWVRLFLPIRKKLNYRLFDASVKENNITLELVQGMPEIRLQSIEQAKRWQWENAQARIFRLTYKEMSLAQLQQAGSILINQGKDVLLTFMVAKMVIAGELTLGTMLAVQYILGQMIGPVIQFNEFIQNMQDAKISMERLNQVHAIEDEEGNHKKFVSRLESAQTISISQLSFSYPGATSPVLQNLNLQIPKGKITAIVGVSGSGKTTLVKLLLKFYHGYEGEISVGGIDFKTISPFFWRKHCGAVLQDGYIFNDTIAKNIAVEYDDPDQQRLIEACRTANILSFIESLPNGFNTRLGVDGMGISQGQKQRLLIARSVYRQPDFLFFDESTNALDANNERIIVENLQEFFKKRTVLVVAHRLSTVRNADNIIVLHEGQVAEQGNHQELSNLKGKYYSLVKNQLELGE